MVMKLVRVAVGYREELGKGLGVHQGYVLSPLLSIILLEVLSREGAQWLSGRVLDSRPKGRWFEPHRRHCIVSLSKNINPSLVLVQPRKTRPFITERLLMGHTESNKQTNKSIKRVLNWWTIRSALCRRPDGHCLVQGGTALEGGGHGSQGEEEISTYEHVK